MQEDADDESGGMLEVKMNSRAHRDTPVFMDKEVRMPDLLSENESVSDESDDE